MRIKKETITVTSVRKAYEARSADFRNRLLEFEELGKTASDDRLFEEMVYCFFTGGCSAKMGLRAVEAVRPILFDGTLEALTSALVGVHRYPRARAGYVITSREYLREHCGLQLRKRLGEFDCAFERRDWLVRDKGIKGLGYKEASHFLRNVGYRGYAILDKHVSHCMAELGLIKEPKPPNSRSVYLSVEQELKQFADRQKIDFDELDLVLWSMRTGEILK